MSLWQTQSWQDMLTSSGQAEEYFMIERNIDTTSSLPKGENCEKVVIFVEKRKVSLGEYGLFVIGLEWEYDEDLKESLEWLCKEENCLFIQVETIDYSFSHSGRKSSKGDRGKKYYKKFIPPYTALIDLTLGEQEILARMKPKGRYNIRLAEKKWVVVEQVDKHIGNIKKFHALMSDTTSRDSFAGNTLEYYKVFLESLDDSQMFFAYHDGEVIAAGIFVVSGEVMTYYYGASSNHKRNLMAPYLLQWWAIQHGIKRGCKIYDFLWVAGDEEKSSSLNWVTDFKMKLSPGKYHVSRSYIFVHKKLKYLVISVLRTLKK